MKIQNSAADLATSNAEVLALAIKQGGASKDAQFKAIDKKLNGALSSLVAREEFVGKSGETLRLALTAGTTRWVLLIGIGNKLDVASARMFAIRATQASLKCASLALYFPADGDETLSALAEGVSTGGYKYATYLTGDRTPKYKLNNATVFAVKKSKGSDKALARGVALAESVILVRDLVNAPPNDLTPTALANAAVTHAKKYGVTTKVWDKKALEKLNMQLFLAVGRGSAQEPRMVQMSWVPKTKKKTKRIVFVGKGLTFDSGGLCIKPAGGMIDMKCDMAGAAVTIGILLAAARLELPIEIHGLFGATENMTGPEAYRPGDIFKSYEGKTVEIINTDAEGRLVLADVLAFATELEPDYLIDHATLTGACMVALGPWTAGIFANDDTLATRYAGAAKAEGESYWRLPLNPDLRDSLKSEVADMKHTGDRNGGAITAALFLEEFVGKTKWMHLDIAGPAFLDRAHGQFPKGGTGFGVATGLRFLEDLV